MNHVKLGTLFVFIGATAIVSSFFLFDATVSGYEVPLGGFALGAVYTWLGFQLRQRNPRARFFALGPCLLMTIGAWLMPLILLGTWTMGSALVQLGESRGLFVWSRGAAATFLLLALVYVLVVGVIAFRGLKYLRSVQGRHDFEYQTVPAPAKLPFESKWVIVGSAAVAILAVIVSQYLDFRIRARYLPEFLQTREMTEFERRMQALDRKLGERQAQRQRQQEIDDARLVVSAVLFSADSRRVVALANGRKPQVLALDLDTGKLRRTTPAGAWNATSENIVLTRDASTIVSGNTVLSLITGQSREVGSIPRGMLIGMPAVNRVLAYDNETQKLALIDLDHGTAIYRIDAPLSDRANSYDDFKGWTPLSQLWSEDRSRYLWLTRDGVIHDLEVPAGRVSTMSCVDCKLEGATQLSSTGDVVLFVGNSMVSEDDPRKMRATLYDLGTRELSVIEHRSRPMVLGDHGRFVLLKDQRFGQETDPGRIYHYDLSSTPTRRLVLEVPSSMWNFGLRRGNPSVITTFYQARAKATFADLESPKAGKSVRFTAPRLALQVQKWFQESPDGRFLMHLSGDKVEIVDVQAFMRGEPANRVVDLFADEELKSVEPTSVADEPFVSEWKVAPEPKAAQ